MKTLFFLPCLNFTLSMEPLKHAVHVFLYHLRVSKNCPILTQEVLILSMTEYFSQTQMKKPLKVILHSHRLLLLDLVDTVGINRDEAQYEHSALTSPGGMPTQILSTAGFRFRL